MQTSLSQTHAKDQQLPTHWNFVFTSIARGEPVLIPTSTRNIRNTTSTWASKTARLQIPFRQTHAKDQQWPTHCVFTSLARGEPVLMPTTTRKIRKTTSTWSLNPARSWFPWPRLMPKTTASWIPRPIHWIFFFTSSIAREEPVLILRPKVSVRTPNPYI